MSDDKRQCGNCVFWRPYRSVSGHCTNRAWMEFTGKPIPMAFEYPSPMKTFRTDGVGCRAFEKGDWAVIKKEGLGR